MLNIPQVIKDQFKIDNVLKNIRISFPNGEHADICNDQIIKETLKFDESISSREEVKFGLCESSTLSFECVDVENIKGMEIAADIEIDATDVEPVDEYGCTENKPVAFMIRPSGETEDLIFIICDFPYREAGAADYTAEDGTDIIWTYTDGSGGYPAGLVRNRVQNRSISLDDYRQLAGVDPRGTYEDMYDGYHGGGYERTYLFSVKTGKFYKCVRVDYFPYNDYVDLRGVLAEGFTNDVWFDALGQIEWDDTRDKYIWHWDADIHTSSDVPFPFYRVPLGHFIVNECKRNASMVRRKVVAYSKESSLQSYDWWTEINWYSTSGMTSDEKVDLDIINFIAATTPKMFDTSDKESVTFTRSGDSFSLNISITGNDRNTYNFKLEIYGCWYADIYDDHHLIEGRPWPSTAYLGLVEKSVLSSSYQTSIDEAIAGFEGQNVPDDVIQQIINIISYYKPFNVLNAYRNPDIFSTATYYVEHSSIYGVPITQQKGKEFKEGDLFIMPWKLALYSQILVTNMSGHAADSFRIYLSDAGLNIDNVLKISKVNIFDGYRLTVPIKSNILISGIGSFTVRSFLLPILSLDMRKFLEGNIEVMGCFGRAGRNGYFELLSLKDIELNGLFPDHDIYPNEALYPTEYSPITIEEPGLAIIDDDYMIDLWYEEYCVKFGGLTLTYMSSEILDENDNPMETTYTLQWDQSENAVIYDLSNNEYIKASTWTSAQIETLVAPLVQALKNVKFYPHDMKCVGLPYIEAGDWVLASYHGNRILGLILSRTLDGIQAMRDKMKSD